MLIEGRIEKGFGNNQSDKTILSDSALLSAIPLQPMRSALIALRFTDRRSFKSIFNNCSSQSSSQNSMLPGPAKELFRLIHSSLNFPAFTQAINAFFSFPILRAIAVHLSFPKQLNCKTRPFVLQSDARL
jgi:hypothetical protein